MSRNLHGRGCRAAMAAAAALALLSSGCGDDEPSGEGAASPVAEPAASAAGSQEASPGPLLEQAGELGASDPSDGRGRFDRYFVDVGAQERVVVTLTSSAFDPILEVTPPSSGALVNDDWRGDRTRSQIELVSPSGGSMKIEVRAYGQDGQGAYRLTARRLSVDGAEAPEGSAAEVPVLTRGESVDGELAQGDHALSGGEVFDSFVVRIGGRARIAVRGRGGAAVRTTLVGPDGLSLEEGDEGYEASANGNYRLQVIGAPGTAYRVQVEPSSGEAAPLFARAHHQFNQILSQLGGTPLASPGSGGAGSSGAGSSGAGSSVGGPRAGGSSAAPSGGAAGGGQATPHPGVVDVASGGANPPRTLPIRLGDRLNGNLADNDERLPSGELYDVYELQIPQGGAPGEVVVDMESSAIDCFVRVDGPGGQHWENDDHGGTPNSRVVLPGGQAGTYRIVTTSYRPGETGPYELKVLTQRDAAQDAGEPAAGGGPDVAIGPERRIDGELAESDAQLRSGEYGDEHRFEWQAGSRVHLEAQSTDFDTYLIVHPPSGPQQDNDDMVPGQTLNAGMDLQVGEGGTWRVVVTSYRPGETGRYALVVRGADGAGGASSGGGAAGTPPGGGSEPVAGAGSRVEQGSLAQGDAQLRSGELMDAYPMTFTPRSRVSIRVESSDFDTYLIVRSPSGHQEDNDDIASGNLNSGIDIPVAEPGNYRVIVTSYRPGETGDYTLRIEEGDSVVAPPSDPSRPPSGGGRPPAASGDGRVWGLFAGITDYPGGTSDLPECANDARKLAEAVRNQGNMPSDQEFLFTDSQATTANIRQAMQTIGARIRPDDVFVFFYSGHGGQTEQSQDEQELDRRDEYLLAYDGQLMDDDLGSMFDDISGRVALVAIDACFAGGFAKDVITRPGRVGMFSSEEDVTSAVAGRFQAGGYLSHFLRLGIQGEADNDPHNEILTVGELTHYTWRQFGQHASDVRMSMGYQHLVVDRGAVGTNEVLWAVRR